MKKIDIRDYLTANFIGRSIEYHETITSTNIRAKEIAREADEGTVVIAEEQTMGKGRLGRNWTSPKGKGLWFSIILKPKVKVEEATKITLIGAAAVYKALKDMGIESYIKWPNDIVIDGKKVCGILTEMIFRDKGSYFVIIGIGINVNLDEEDFNEDLKNKATSLKLVRRSEVDRNKLFAYVLNNFEILYIPFKEKGDIREAIEISRERSILIGKEVRIIGGNREKTARVLGIDNEGQLIVKYRDGKTEALFSGEVSIRGMEGYMDNC